MLHTRDADVLLPQPPSCPRTAHRPPAALQFGMYRWENDGSQVRTPHKSVPLLKQWFERLPERVVTLLRLRREQPRLAAEDAEAGGHVATGGVLFPQPAA